MKVNIKPLSVNEAWQGKRFKTEKYKKYESVLLLLLPKINIPKPPYKIELTFGMSNYLSDFDNPVKPFIDVLQKKYGFNDRDIIEANIKKTKVNKGNEFIIFNIQNI